MVIYNNSATLAIGNGNLNEPNLHCAIFVVYLFSVICFVELNVLHLK